MAPGMSLVIVGAILAFAVRTDASVVDLQVVGLIFMLAGGAIIAYYKRERHQKQIVTRVEHKAGAAEPGQTVEETLTRETVYEGDEPPPVPRSVPGYDGL
jgi:hypothetical protein